MQSFPCLSLIIQLNTLNTINFVLFALWTYPKHLIAHSHKILLNKLPFYNIDYLSSNIIKSFLEKRMQHVPQGSTLSALLFLIYINDLPPHVSSETVLFADETTLINANDTLGCLINDCVGAATQELPIGLWRINCYSMKVKRLKFAYFEKAWKFPELFSRHEFSWKSNRFEIIVEGPWRRGC